MLDNARLNVLYQKFVISQEMPDDEIPALTLEELSFIYVAAEAAKKDEKFKHIHFPIKQQIIYWAAVDAFKKAESLYIAYGKMPTYPYIDPSGAVWVFSDEEIAKRVAENIKKKEQLELMIRKIDNKLILPMTAQMIYMGVDRIIVDNGVHPMLLKRSDILPETDWNQNGQNAQGQDFKNGPLQMAMIQFFQYVQFNVSLQKEAASEDLSEEQKEALKKRLEQSQKVLRILESRMLSNLVDAKFLVPMVVIKDGKPLPPNQSNVSGEGVTRRIANLVDGNKTAWLPAFTDWTEFSRTYKPTEWGALIMSYENLITMSKDMKINRIVFNARGCAFRVDEKLMERIEAFRQRKAELEAKRAAEQPQEAAENGKKAEPKKTADEGPTVLPIKQQGSLAEVSYEELEEIPDLMEGALKRTAKAMKPIKRMWLAERIQGSDRGYLLVIEATSDGEEMVAEMKRASAGYLDGKTMEVREADEEAMELVQDIRPFYKKGIFG